MRLDRSANTFFSWSGDLSNVFAGCFFKYLPLIIQNSSIFYSPISIEKDKAWFGDIQKRLSECKTGIVFLTQDNIQNPWILFESGGIASKGTICVLLCNLKVDELVARNSIFSNFNVTQISSKIELKKMFLTINHEISPMVDDKIIEQSFEKYYDDLKHELDGGIPDMLLNLKVPPTFEEYSGNWALEYDSNESNDKGGETLRIDTQGRYFLPNKNGGEEYYFQLEVTSQTKDKVEWRKIQIFKDSPSKYVHSTETLKIHDGELKGHDNLGYKLVYKRLNCMY